MVKAAKNPKNNTFTSFSFFLKTNGLTEVFHTMSEERVIPGISHPYLLQEHVDRYKFALELVKGKKVLDVACGSGYGSKMLSEVAYNVTAVDISQESVDYAREHYSGLNIAYVVSDACKLPFEDNEFDVIVSFETVEHIENYEKFISECRRVLKERGCLIISTPNAETSQGQNHYHIKEFTVDEFGNLLKKHFTLIGLHGQRSTNPMKGSVVSLYFKIKEFIGIKKAVFPQKNCVSYPVGYFKNGIEKSVYIIAVCY